MFTLAHLSDLHLASRPHGWQLLSKRGLGYINWLRKREKVHRPEVLDAITGDLKTQSFDHIAVTGDLVNFSLAEEYVRARSWLETLGHPRDVTVMPGNHDVYVRGVEGRPAEFWADYMRGDDGLDRFPFLRRRGDVALIALSTGVPTGPFMATGRLGAGQLSRLAETLEQTRDLFRIVLIHHPPSKSAAALSAPPRRCPGAAPACWPKKAQAFCCTVTTIASRCFGSTGPAGQKSPRSACRRRRPRRRTAMKARPLIICSRSTSAANGANKWRCAMIARQRGADGVIRETGRKVLF